jgi:hypothetical protein
MSDTPRDIRHRDKLIFAGAVLHFARAEHTTNLSAYLTVCDALGDVPGRLRSYDAFRKFLSRNRHALSQGDALSREISRTLRKNAMGRGDVRTQPTVTVHASRRDYAREVSARDHADIEQSAAAIERAIRADDTGALLRKIVREYVASLSGR